MTTITFVRENRGHIFIVYIFNIDQISHAAYIEIKLLFAYRKILNRFVEFHTIIGWYLFGIFLFTGTNTSEQRAKKILVNVDFKIDKLRPVDNLLFCCRFLAQQKDEQNDERGEKRENRPSERRKWTMTGNWSNGNREEKPSNLSAETQNILAVFFLLSARKK